MTLPPGRVLLLGRISLSNRVLAFCEAGGHEEAKVRAAELAGFTLRHTKGDFGLIMADAHDLEVNRKALSYNLTVLSIYEWRGTKLYINTSYPLDATQAKTSVIFWDEY